MKNYLILYYELYNVWICKIDIIWYIKLKVSFEYIKYIYESIYEISYYLEY